MKRIPLGGENGKGKFALVDDEDFKIVSLFKWCTTKGYSTNYAQTYIWFGQNEKPINIRMHRLIINAPIGKEVDHINHNGLDNRKSNLRFCTRSQNNQNRIISKHKQKTSRYKGVAWDKTKNKWKANIQIYKKFINIGKYDSETKAAKAYDKKALELFREFAHLNFK